MTTPWSRFLVVVLVGALAVSGCGSDDGDTSSGDSTSSSSSSSTSTSTTETTVADSTTSTTEAPTDQSSMAIWPFADGATFDDPVDAASSFAVDYLGFVDPVVGEFQAGDSRSGEVTVQPNAQGPDTTVLVRQLDATDSWSVIGASTANLQLASPEGGASVASPVAISGQSTAFEATVNVEVRQDGSVDPLVEDFVMGGSMGEMGPFSGSMEFAAPTAEAGAIILKTLSAMDGNISEATVVRVVFGE